MKKYLFPLKLWQSYQLGLYQTVLRQQYYLPTRQAHIIRTLAQLKRFEIDKPENVINRLLSENVGNKWFNIAIKELAPIYPQIIFDFLTKYMSFLPQSSFLFCIQTALSLQFGKVNTALLTWLDDNERLLFLSNLTDNLKEKQSLCNRYLKKFELTPLKDNTDFGLDKFEFLATEKIDSIHQVTVLVTAYNAQNTIYSCIKSLLNQSWQNIQVIVIDDCSNDDTLSIVKSIADDRIKIIELAKNVGTFVAKSIGAMFATGEFLTCQDSDDIAHPDKIKEQVLPLIQYDKLIATHSYWLRMDKEGDYYARQYYPLLRHNPASPMFRLKKVRAEVGLWHIARTGADSEFFERLKLVYGKEAVLPIKKPLTFASHNEQSLMNSVDYGVHNKDSALDRLDYWENWRLWHIDCIKTNKTPIMPTLSEQIESASVFEIPPKLVVNLDDIRHNLAHCYT